MDLISLILMLGPILMLVVVLFWWARDESQVWQFPLLMILVHIGIVFPQTLGLALNPGVLPPNAVRDGGIAKMLLMTNLCLAAGLAGYMFLRPAARGRKICRAYDMEKLFRGGLVLVLIGYVGVLLQARLRGGAIALLSVYDREGAYEGLPVVFDFIAGAMAPGMACCILSTLTRPTRKKWCAVLAGHFWPMVVVFLFGRREGTLGVLLVWAILLFFVRKWLPPRWTILVAFVVGSLFVLVAPDYREQTRIGGDWGQILRIDPVGKVKDLLEGHGSSEAETAMVQIAAYDRAGKFLWGRSLWNHFVSDWVPRILVGSELKESLYLPGPSADVLTARYYAWQRGTGVMVPISAELFREFWYLGCGVIFVMGGVFRRLWVSSVRYSNPMSQVWYCLLLTGALVGVAGGVLRTPAYVLYLAMWLAPVWFYSRLPRRRILSERAPNSRRGIAGVCRAGMLRPETCENTGISSRSRHFTCL